MDETKQQNGETQPAADETGRPDRHPRMVTPETELVEETRDRIAQRRPDPSDKPRKAPGQAPAPPWFLHPDERREFKRLAEGSRMYAAELKQAAATETDPKVLMKIAEPAAGEIEALCEAIERLLEADGVMQREVDRLTRENSGLLNTVARWQDYGEGRIPQPPADAELPELPESSAEAGRTGEEPAWEALYRRKVAECLRIQEELDEARLELEKARKATAAVEAPPTHVSYVVNFIAGRESAASR
jgi:hypothetical protein